MTCPEPCNDDSDRFDAGRGQRPFDHSATGWLIGQAVRALNSDDDEGKLGFVRTGELLRERKDALHTLTQMVHETAREDVPLRWALVRLIGEVADPAAADPLAKMIVEHLPEDDRQQGCEGPLDGELLVRTMAIEALAGIATRHAAAGDHLLKIVAARPHRALLVEVVKAAATLGLKDKVAELLGEGERWMLELRQARLEEVFPEAERRETGERSFIPKLREAHTAPNMLCHPRKEC